MRKNVPYTKEIMDKLKVRLHQSRPVEDPENSWDGYFLVRDGIDHVPVLAVNDEGRLCTVLHDEGDGTYGVMWEDKFEFGNVEPIRLKTVYAVPGEIKYRRVHNGFGDRLEELTGRDLDYILNNCDGYVWVETWRQDDDPHYRAGQRPVTKPTEDGKCVISYCFDHQLNIVR